MKEWIGKVKRVSKSEVEDRRDRSRPCKRWLNGVEMACSTSSRKLIDCKVKCMGRLFPYQCSFTIARRRLNEKNKGYITGTLTTHRHSMKQIVQMTLVFTA